MLLQPRQKFVLIGDSITDSRRRDTAPPYGDGYVSIVRNLILARYPELSITFVNRGIGGHTVRDLAARWQTDVLDEQPDWLAVCIGINDAYQEIPLAEYQATLSRLLTQTQQARETAIVLLTPFLIEAERTDVERLRMDSYGTIVKALAREHQVRCVDLQVAFDDVLRSTPQQDWSDDRVHPGGPGHAVIALALLRELAYTLL